MATKKELINKCSGKVKGKERVYELTTNARAGFGKYYVRGIKNDSCAKKISKAKFGKDAWTTSGGVNYYDDHPSEYSGDKWKKAKTVKQFLEEKY